MKPRTFSSGSGLTTVDSYYTRTYSNGSSDTYGPFVHVESVDSSSLTGYNIQDYRKKKAAGELLPMTPFRQFSLRGSANGVIVTNNHSGNFTDAYTTNIPWFGGWMVSEDTLVDLASEISTEDMVQAAAARIYSDGWDGLTFIAELKKTRAMFSGFVSRFINNIRRGRFDNIWLEGRYGWRILWMDMVDIHQAIEKIDDRRTRFSQRVGTSENITDASTQVVEWSAATNTFHVMDEISISRRGSVVADITPPKVQFNPILTGWELITFSFVIDWIIDIGQWLEAMSFIVLSSQYTAAGGIYISVKRTVENTTVFKPNFSGEHTFRSECNASLTLRTPCSVSQVPLLQLKLDSLKVVDLLALVHQYRR